MSGDLLQRLLRGLLLATSIASAFAFVEFAMTASYRANFGPGNWVMAQGIGSAYAHHPRPGHGHSNNFGLRRSEDTSAARPASIPRVLSYGDSVAHGFALSTDETYAHGLETRLRAHLGKPVEVLNMFRGHSPSVHAFHIRQDVPLLSPDAVLLEIELLNDVADEAFVVTSGTDRFGLPEKLLAARYVVSLDGHLLSPAANGSSLWERTLIYAKARRWLGRQRGKWSPNPVFGKDSDTAYYVQNAEHYLLTQRALDRGFDRMFESIAGIHRYLESRQIEFQLMIVPARDIYEGGTNARGALRLLQRAEDRARELEFPFLSLRAAMGTAGGAALYMDFCHPTAAGNAAIVEAVFDTVLEMITRRLALDPTSPARLDPQSS